MIQPHTGQDRKLGIDHIGGIESPAQTGFNNRQVYLLFLELEEGNRGHQFKKGWPDSLLGIFVFFKIGKTVIHPVFYF